MYMRDLIGRVHINVDKLAVLADKPQCDMAVASLARQMHEDLAALMRAAEEKSDEDLSTQDRLRTLEANVRHQRSLGAQWSDEVIKLTRNVEIISRALDAMEDKLESMS